MATFAGTPVDSTAAPQPAAPKPVFPGTPIAPAAPEPDDLLPLLKRLEGSGPQAVSPKGAVGTYQIMPNTAKQYGRDPARLGDEKYNEETASVISADLRKRFPGDTEAQVGQGPITFHSEEHLMTSDQGIAMLRQMFQRQLEAIAAGKNPVGVAFNEPDAYVKFDAGQYLED